MEKMDLKDLSVLIALKIDSQDRLDNLDLTIKYLQDKFDINIIISEMDTIPKLKNRYACEYVFIESEAFFNRQKTLNGAAKRATTEYIVHYDADVLFEVKQITETMDLLRNNIFDVIYPYDGRFHDIPKKYYNEINEKLRFDTIDIDECRLLNPHSVGGAVFFKREVFVKGGMANENFLGLGYEDNEINSRFTKLGYRMGRVNGPLYHLTHIRGITSYDKNPHVQNNWKEFFRINGMTKEQLENEIKTWSWLNGKI